MPYFVDIARQFVQRRKRLITTTSAVVLLLLLLTYRLPQREYQIELKFIVGRDPLPQTDTLTQRGEEERYYRWVASEYEVYAVTDWLNGTQFSQDVSDKLVALGYKELDEETVNQYMYAEAARSRLLINVVYQNKQTLELIAQIVLNTLSATVGNNQLTIPQLGSEPVQLFPIDVTDKFVIQDFNPPVSAQFSLPLRIILGLLSGFVVAAIFELYDPTIYHRSAIKHLKLPLLGEIPARKPHA